MVTKKIYSLAIIGLLASCGAETPIDNGSTVKAEPTGYSILPRDLYRDVPNDLCRFRDRDFLQKLISRARSELPSESLATFRLEDFSVTDGYEGKNREAVLRFRVTRAGVPNALMYAIGPFDPNGCKVGKLRIGVGADPYVDSGKARAG